MDDGVGPQISMFINSRDFEDGDKVKNSLSLIADLFDENGIHATGNSLGRDIVAVIDDDYSNSMILNTYFCSDANTYKNGKLNVDLKYLEEGWHTINLKVWDLMNNSSERTVEFLVVKEEFPALSEVYNYPNPFNESTTFTCKFGGDQVVKSFEIEIFNINGQFVINLVSEKGNSTKVLKIEWNGLDQNGNSLPQGFYLYNVLVTDEIGNTSVLQQKMIKLSN